MKYLIAFIVFLGLSGTVLALQSPNVNLQGRSTVESFSVLQEPNMNLQGSLYQVQ